MDVPSTSPSIVYRMVAVFNGRSFYSPEYCVWDGRCLQWTFLLQPRVLCMGWLLSSMDVPSTPPSIVYRMVAVFNGRSFYTPEYCVWDGRCLQWTFLLQPRVLCIGWSLSSMDVPSIPPSIVYRMVAVFNGRSFYIPEYCV